MDILSDIQLIINKMFPDKIYLSTTHVLSRGFIENMYKTIYKPTNIQSEVGEDF